MSVNDGSEIHGSSSPASPLTRPFYWSVRRELWENRMLYMAPLSVAAFALFGFCMSMIGMAGRRRAVLLLGQAARRSAIQEPYDVVAMMFILTGFLVGAFYSLDALYGERKDRSILFWKSLPVSDTTTVLSKLSVPMAVVPVITLVITICTQIGMLMFSSMYLVAHGISPMTTVENLQFGLNLIVLPYGLATLVLWHAPLYGWLLLVSAWAKRATLLWAVLPFVAIGALEHVALRTKYVGKFLQHRLAGGIERAFAFERPGVIHSIDQLTPFAYLSSPGLWAGLVAAALLIAAAIRLRRNREPI